MRQRRKGGGGRERKYKGGEGREKKNNKVHSQIFIKNKKKDSV